MRKVIIPLLALLALQTAYAKKTPLMGWSSWNTFAVGINDTLIKGQADAMVSQGLKDVGYEYINIDDGFFGGRDKDGNLKINTRKFPKGLKPVVDHIHRLGLKAGIYSDAGNNTCGNKYNADTIAHGVGLYGHDKQDCDFFFRRMEFDFIKVDFCGGVARHNHEWLDLDPRERYTEISKAIRSTGRDVRFNVCRWDYPGTWVNGVADSWRISHDIACNWNSIKDIIQQNLYLSAYCSGGKFNDMDMLEIGRGLPEEEERTHFAVWCMMSSPLLIGCDLRTVPAASLALLKNDELIAVDQDSLCLQAYVARRDGDCVTLVKDIAQPYGLERVMSVTNLGDTPQTVKVDMKDLDLGGKVSVRELTERKDLAPVRKSLSVTLPPHATRVYRLKGSKRLERELYEAETGYIETYQELMNNRALKTGTYEEDEYASGGAKATFLGWSDENSLQFRNVYSKNGGTYTLTIGYFSPETREIAVAVNGGGEERIICEAAPGRAAGKVKIKIHLDKGENLIRLSNTTSRMPDIDYIRIR